MSRALRLIIRSSILLPAARSSGEGNTMTIIGKGVVRITDGADHGGAPFYTLQPGARFDLASWQTQ